MNDFTFHNPAMVVFGRGKEEMTGALVKQHGGKKVLLHYGGGSIKRIGLYARVVESLRREGIEFVELGGVQPNPRLSLVREGVALCKQDGVDFILAVGGGSVIDSAKAIAAATLTTKKDIWEYYMNDPNGVSQALPIGVVLTIPAAGSETSDSSVITNEDGAFKRSIGGSCLIPRFAVLNPELTFSLPPYQTACGASDILAHLFERYFTQVRNVDLTDRLLEASMKTILLHTPIALREPENYNARSEIMWVGTLAHNNLLNTGRTGDWASHEIEHELSGIYDIAHGAGLAIVFPAWMRYVYRKSPHKFVQLAVRVFDVDLAFEDEGAIVREMIERLERWYRLLGLPVRLSEAGIPEDRIGEMSGKALVGRQSIGAYQTLGVPDVEAILRLAL